MADRQELVIDDIPGECRVALLENDQVVEIDVGRSAHHSQIGNIYRGRIDSVVPSLQAAFVTIAPAIQGFLSIRDALVLAPDDGPGRPRLENFVHEGQWVLVQITRDGVGDKGPRLTASVTLPGRYLVYQPLRAGIGVSSRIGDEDERARLEDIASKLLETLEIEGGFVVRTVADGAPEDALRIEAEALAAAWAEVDATADTDNKPACLFEELGSVERALRDWALPGIDQITVEGHALHARIKQFLDAQMPDLADKLAVHSDHDLLFEDRGVEAAIDETLEVRLPTDNGGWITIEGTEALTAIDVNSGGRTREGDREQNALHANLAAVPVIARHMRLRDIGGQIVVDFIHMREQAHRDQVIAAMEEALAPDKSPTQVLGFSRLSLLEITRRRSRKSLPDFLTGARHMRFRARLRSAESTGYDIMRHAALEAHTSPVGTIRIQAHGRVVAWLNDGPLDALAHLADRAFEAGIDADMAIDEFDVYTAEPDQ